jgi:putative membrane protein
MAGLLYLPRLFVYHSAAAVGSDLSETFKVMERRLYKAIMNPAMIVVWITGPWLAWRFGHYDERWFWAKMVMVGLMSWYHHVLLYWLRDFAADKNQRPSRFFRMANEIPTVLMIFIVVLVIVRPSLRL